MTTRVRQGVVCGVDWWGVAPDRRGTVIRAIRTQGSHIGVLCASVSVHNVVRRDTRSTNVHVSQPVPNVRVRSRVPHAPRTHAAITCPNVCRTRAGAICRRGTSGAPGNTWANCGCQCVTPSPTNPLDVRSGLGWYKSGVAVSVMVAWRVCVCVCVCVCICGL